MRLDQTLQVNKNNEVASLVGSSAFPKKTPESYNHKVGKDL